MLKSRIFHTRRGLQLIAVVAALAAAGVALGVVIAVPDDSETERIDVLQFDRSPLTDAKEVAGVEEAAAELPFEPIVPIRLGDPKSVFIHALSDREQQTLALVYETPAYGVFFVYESPQDPGVTDEAIRDGFELQAAECSAPSSGCEGTWTIVTLTDDTRALLIEGSKDVPTHTSSAQWCNGNICFNVVGPISSFSGDDARSLAGLFAVASVRS